MPEFVLDLGADARLFSTLDSFTQGYVEAIFFTECHSDNPELEDATFSDLSLEALSAIGKDCTDFNLAADTWLHKAYLHGDMSYDMRRAGNDFWHTRNGHGVGFWDRGLGAAGEELTKLAECHGTCDVYRGDDGKVYFS